MKVGRPRLGLSGKLRKQRSRIEVEIHAAADAGRVVIGEVEFVQHARTEGVGLDQARAIDPVAEVTAVAISRRITQGDAPGIANVAVVSHI